MTLLATSARRRSGATLYALPGTLNNNYMYNIEAFTQDNVTTADDGTVYAVWWNNLRKPIVGKIVDGEWVTFDLSTVTSNPLAWPVLNDAHANLSMAVAGGKVFVSGNMHNDGLRMVSGSVDFTGWSGVSISGTTDVTYPRFVRFSDGQLSFFWRNGGSGNGDLLFSTWNGVTWTAATTVVNGAALVPDVSPYAQRIVADRNDTLHLFWIVRETSNAATNRDVHYARSTDRGATWTRLDGTPLTLPIPAEGPTLVHDTGPTFSGIYNQNGADVDASGNPHTAFHYNDASGNAQIIHFWHNGISWQYEQVTSTTTPIPYSSSGVSFLVSRPSLVCTAAGQTLILWRYAEDGHVLRVIDVTTPGNPVHSVLADHGWGPTGHFTFDSVGARDHGRLRMLLTETTDQTTGFESMPGWMIDVPLGQVAETTFPAAAFL